MEEVDRAFLLDALPPCGLSCYSCAEFDRGGVREHAGALLQLHEGYRDYLAKSLPDKAEKFEVYLEVLRQNACAACPGCRKKDGGAVVRSCVAGCFILRCCGEHGVDFCWECGEFPCGKVRESDLFSPGAKRGFLEGGMYMREHGPLAFFAYEKGKGHHRRHKRQE